MAGGAAGALLETLVHLEVDREDMPSNYQLLRVYLDADVSEQDCGELPVGWREDVGLTRQIGDTWLRVCDSLLLRVPSAIAPGTFNYLFNPLHEEAYDAEVPPLRYPPATSPTQEFKYLERPRRPSTAGC